MTVLTTHQLQNASSSVSGSFASSTDLGGTVIVVVYAAVLFAALGALHNQERFERLAAAIAAAGESVRYAMMGLVTVVAVSAVLAPAWAVLQVDAGTRAVAAKWLGIALAAYLGLVALGYVADRVVDHFRAANPALDEWLAPEPAPDGGDEA